MTFDPSQPFEIEEEATGFDPSQPFEVEDDKPALGEQLETMGRMSEGSPDANARLKQLADRAGVPYQAAKEIPEELERDTLGQAWRKFSEVAPSASKFLSENVPIFDMAQDDHEALGEIERVLVGLGKQLPGIGNALQAADAGMDIAGGKVGATLDAMGGSVKTWDNMATQAGLGLFMGTEALFAKWARPDNVNAEYVKEYREKAQGILDLIKDEPNGKFKDQLVAQWGVIPQQDGTIEPEAALRNIGLKLAQMEYDNSESEKQRKDRADILTEMSADEAAVIKAANGKLEKYTLPWLAAGVADMIGQVLPAAAAGVVGGPAAALAVFGGQAGGTAYAEGKQEGMEDGRALENAAVYMLTEGLGETVGLGAIRKAINASTPAVRAVGEALLTNWGEEQATQIMQQAYDAVRNGKAPEIPDYIKDLNVPEELKMPLAFLDEQIQAGIIGAFGGGTMAAGGAAAKAGIDKYNERKQAKLDEQVQRVREQIDTARTRSSQIIETIEKVRTSKLKARDTSSLRALIQSVGDAETNEAPAALLLSADAFKQGGIDPEVFKRAIPSAADQVDRAIELGGTIAIDIGELANITDSEVEQGLIPHLKVTEDEWTQYEAESAELQSDEAMAEMQEAADMAAREAENQDEWTRQADEIRTKYEEQLNKVGQYDKAANKKMAALVSAFYSTTASKLAKHDPAMTPTRLFNDAMMQVKGGMGSGQVFNQDGLTDDEIDFYVAQGIYTQEEADKIKVENSSSPQGKAVENEQSTGPRDNQDAGYIQGESDLLARLVRASDSIGIDRGRTPGLVGAQHTQAASYSDLSLRGGTFVRDERSPEVIKTESDRLIARAKNNGFFIDKEAAAYLFSKLSSNKLKAGIEHNAYRMGGDDGGVVLRVTAGGRYGPDETKSPAQYLHRIEEYNRTFPDIQMRVIGVGQSNDGKAYILTAQKYVNGKEFENMDQLHAALVAHGWEAMERDHEGKLTASRYRNKKTGAIISDVHEGNVLHDAEGNLYPIDVHVEQLPKHLLYQNESAPRGAFDRNKLNIYLLEGADLSTFLHESGHFFLEMYARYADQSAEIGKDMDALLKWFGVDGDDQAARLTSWRAMSVDQQRAMHEKFAESFEQYLFKGNAPSVELQPVFSTFRRWLTSVYKSLARFVASHSGASLNPEIAGVMDRMIATQDQIDEMTQARDSRPLFANADQAGMTQAQWDAYMQDQVRSVELAADSLVARSLRDMKWLTNAKNKQLRKLQREAQALRAQVQMEAKREILSIDIYRAWLFLKRATEKKAKKPANTKTADPAQDGLLTAIAKNGGLDMDEVVRSWGVDPADFNKKGGVFGKPVLRKTGGLSIESMAERLLDDGYLTPDEHGKFDQSEFEDKLSRSARGDSIYSVYADYDLLMHGDKEIKPRSEDVDYIGGRLSRSALQEMYGTNNPEVKWHKPVEGMLLQPAYHGSPYKFDKFSLDHMGKGEGAQAYGWGLYFAGAKEVAEYYRKSLSQKDGSFNQFGFIVDELKKRTADMELPDSLIGGVASYVWHNKQTPAAAVQWAINLDAKNRKVLRANKDALIKAINDSLNAEPDKGQLYKVEIPEDDTYLLWDKRVSEQSKQVQEALKNMLKNFSGRPSHKDVVQAMIDADAVGGAIYGALDSGFGNEPGDRMGAERSSKELNRHGINGIRYLDGSSRGKGEGNYNYVVFDDNAIEIVETFYQNKDEDQNEPGAVRNLESMGMVSDDGLHPDTVAELFGLSSGDELVRKLLEIDDPFTAVDKLTDKIMLERHSEFTDPKEMERMAEAAIHNDARVRFVATELAMLNKAQGGQKDLKRIIDAARLYAQDLLSGQRIADIRPSKHAADAARAGKSADREFAKGNLAATIMAKRNQVLHTELVRQAHAAKDEVDKGLKYFARIEKAVNNGVLDADYAQQIIGLLQRHDLRKSVSLIDLERRESLAAWVQAQQDAGFEPMIPENLLMEAGKTHYKRMTLDEFRELVDAVKNIEHLGRLKYRLVQNARKRELAAAAAEIGQSVTDNATGEVRARLEKNSVKDRIFDLANGFLYMHRKFASLIRQMDGWKDGGVLWDYFVKTMNDAGDREAVMREQATMAMADLMKPLHKSGGFGMMPKKLFITQIGTSLTREGRIMVALNWGNEGNRQRLMDGEGWDVDQVNAILATLNADDWKFVQGVWDHLETYREKVSEQQKRLSGVEPKWIEASPFMVAGRDGQTYELRGGYLPVKYDADRSTKSLTQEALNSIMDQHKAVRAKTRDSFTKGRAAKVVNRPLRKDFGVIFQHLTEVTHRLAWQDWLTDSKRLLAQPAVDEAIRQHYGPPMVEELQKTLDDIATGEVGPSNEFEAAINHLRTGTTVAGLGLNVMTSLLQPLGLTQSMVRIGPTWVMKGLAKWGRMDDALPWIYERSDFMRLRGKTFQREINEELNKIRSPKRSAFNDMMFILIQKGQIIADVPTWLGAYEKAIAEQGPNVDEALAAKLADQAVLDAQSGGMNKDLARIQRGGSLQRLFTMFYSYFNATYNLSVESVRKIDRKDPVTVARAGLDFLLLYSLPAAISTLMKAALTGEDDEDEFWAKMARDQVSYFLAVMVGLREFGAIASGFSGYTGPAGTRFFNEAARLATQVGQGEADAAFWKTLNNTAGILLHYPSGQINKTLQGADALLEDETDNPAALLFGATQ